MAKKRYVISIVAGLSIFTLMLILVCTGISSSIDDLIRNAFYSTRCPGLDAFVSKFTLLGNWQSITAICIIFLLIKPIRFTFGVPLSIGALSLTGLNKIIKHLVARPRPSDISHLVEEGGFSFTSGHSITSMFFFGMLIWLIWKHVKCPSLRIVLTIILIIPMIGIGLSRIYCGMHYPTDVMAGWSLGFSAIFVAVMIIGKVENRKLYVYNS